MEAHVVPIVVENIMDQCAEVITGIRIVRYKNTQDWRIEVNTVSEKDIAKVTWAAHTRSRTVELGDRHIVLG